MRCSVYPLDIVEYVFAKFNGRVNVSMKESDLDKALSNPNYNVLGYECKVLPRQPKPGQQPLLETN